MKIHLLSLSCILLALFLVAAGCTQAGPGAAPAVTQPAETTQVTEAAAGPQVSPATNETLVAFVNSAVAYAKARGPEAALAEFNNRNGSFVKGELYIYAYGFNGTTLAHPVNPEAVGKPREGANGLFVTEMGAVVRNGSGYYRFVYINPQHNDTLESKLGYGAQVADDWWLGSGIYTGPVGNRVTTNETLVAFVDEAVRYAHEHGKEKALAEFSNRSGSFVRGELYIYAYDYNSTTLAHPFSPEMIGKNRTSETDACGNLYAYKFIDAVRNGSGFVRFYYLNPANNRTVESKLGYVRAVDNDWWLGSGVYLGPLAAAGSGSGPSACPAA